MPKIKTKKTLLKRIRITSRGKLIRGQVGTGHLKSKWSNTKKFRKAKSQAQVNRGHIKKFNKLLGNHAKS